MATAPATDSSFQIDEGADPLFQIVEGTDSLSQIDNAAHSSSQTEEHAANNFSQSARSLTADSAERVPTRDVNRAAYTAARAPRNFLIKFTAPCGHRAIEK